MLLRSSVLASSTAVIGRRGGSVSAAVLPPARTPSRLTNGACRGKHEHARVRCANLVARAGSGQSTTANTDLLFAEVKALEAERDAAISAAEACSKTGTKLAEMATLLEQLALEKVRNGDVEGARAALAEKASVKEALEKNSSKADVNYKLASALATRIASKQGELLAGLRSTPPGGSIPPTFSAPSSGTAGASAGSEARFGEGPKWKWQQSLEEARVRLRAQEAEAEREGRMARLTAEDSIRAAKERIAAQAAASVAEAQARLRDQDVAYQGSLAAAQARLKARDDAALARVRSIMKRYRAGEYVPESELEFAFKLLEERFSV